LPGFAVDLHETQAQPFVALDKEVDRALQNRIVDVSLEFFGSRDDRDAGAGILFLGVPDPLLRVGQRVCLLLGYGMQGTIPLCGPSAYVQAASGYAKAVYAYSSVL
jgi:hypothetical protein